MTGIEKTWKIDTNSSLFTHFMKKIDYPLIASENGIGGKVYAQFKVDTLGNIGDIEILNKNDIYLDPSLSKVVLKSFDEIPTWTIIEREKYDGIGEYFAEGKYWTGIYRFMIEFKLIEE